MLKTVIEEQTAVATPINKYSGLKKILTSQNYLISLIGLGIVMLGVIVAMVLSTQNQDQRKDASVADGQVKVSIAPSSREINVNETTTLTTFIDTQNKKISGLAVRLSFPFTGQTPPLTASNPTPLIQQNDPNWQCQVSKTTVATSVVNIDFGCIYSAQTGYSSDKNVPLFSFSLKAGDKPTTAPISLSFDPQQTIVVDKASGQDIAAVPAGTAAISILGQAVNTPTPTPTRSPNPTATPTPPAATPTPTASNRQSNPTPTITPTPTTQPSGLSCNQVCIATRDCASHLTCSNGYCKNAKCPSDNTCQCAGKDVAKESSTSALPVSGGPSHTIWLSIIGGLLIFSGLSFTLFLKTDESY